MTPLLTAALFWWAVVGTVTSAIFCALVVVAALRFRARSRREYAQPATFTPPISVLKPLHGAEPGLALNLATFFQQSYAAPFELVFCARTESDAGLQIARTVAAEYPHVPARFLACGEPLYPNPKMYSFAVMAQAAAYPHLVTSDADARVDKDYLSRCIQALAPQHTVRGLPVELSSCLYRGAIDHGNLFEHLDALGKTVEMSSGVLVADMLSGTNFALGVTMVLQRDAFAHAGGFADLGNYWAEDFVLGNRLAADGRGVEISTHIIRLMVSHSSIADGFRNQLRWMQSTRRSRPLGHLGTGLTFAMPFGLLGCAIESAQHHWAAALIFLALALLNRIVQAAAVLTALCAPSLIADALLYPLRDLLGSIVWLCSYLPAETRYHGTRFRIMPDGRLLSDDELQGNSSRV